MFVEGRIETTNLREITGSQVPFGLDTCTCVLVQVYGEKNTRLLNQRRIKKTEITMQNKKLYISAGVAILLIGTAAFVAGKWMNGGSSREDQASHVTPAPEIPTTTPELSGLLVERKDNTVILQTVSFDPGSGWRLGESNAPIDSSSGPRVEVIVTGETIIYRDNFEFGQSSIQQTVEETTLDYLASQMLITVWGRKNGERVIAELLLAQHLK
jgi:hypothetical protein